MQAGDRGSGQLHVGTWNVAGISEAELGTFVDQLSDNFPWDVVFLQEAFSRTEGIELEFNHQLWLVAVSTYYFKSGYVINTLQPSRIHIPENASHSTSRKRIPHPENASHAALEMR